MKVYIVQHCHYADEYIDHEIIAVFTNSKAAIKFASLYDKQFARTFGPVEINTKTVYNSAKQVPKDVFDPDDD